MTAPLRDRLARLLCKATIAVDGWPTGVLFAWSDLQPPSQERWRTIADALLASDEWQAREAVVEAAINLSAYMGPDASPVTVWLDFRVAVARVWAARGEETIS